MDVAVIVIAVLAVAVAAAGFLMRRGGGGPVAARPASDPRTREELIAAAERDRQRVVSEARTWALQAREEMDVEFKARLEAVDATAGALQEREQTFQERKAIFDDRRFAQKKRREEMDERQAAVQAQRDELKKRIGELAALDREEAVRTILDRVDAELAAEHAERVARAVSAEVGEAEPAARTLIVEAMERQLAGHADGAPRLSPLSLEGLDDAGRERLLNALTVLGEETNTEVQVDNERQQVSLRGQDPLGREVARQTALEIVDRKLQAADLPPLLLHTRSSLHHRVRQLGERALWEMQMDGRPELAELVGTLHYRFSYGQNALLHCEETGHICSVLAAELGLTDAQAREAGMLHDIGKAVDHDVEGSHAIIGGELLRVLGAREEIIHAVAAHHFDVEPSTDLAMLTICADAISASRPGARRDTLASYLARLEQLQGIATRHQGVERAFPLQAGREVRIFVKARQVKDSDVPALSGEIAREIESEMQYPGVIKVTVIRETTATATAPAQIAVVKERKPAVDEPPADAETPAPEATETAEATPEGS